MQFVKDGPFIPSEILHAHEEERLVLFCGAGISRYTGLPGFDGLTRHLFDTCIPTAVGGEPAAQRRQLALQAQDYDLALELLERDLPNSSPMRHSAIARLTRPYDGALSLHRALLGLSAVTGNGHRLVTTNFDRRFVEAGADETSSQAGPRLALPRPNRWAQLTYLHGLINPSTDPDGLHLVLTAGDFGRAYLQDGWAARFLVELFRHWTVLFIGYSLSDPVVRYLVAALATQSSTLGGFRRAFALAGFKNNRSERETVEAAWRGKGVEPVPYRIRQGSDGRTKEDHSLLVDSLVRWSQMHVQGLEGRIAVALRIAANPCADPIGEDARSLVWALSRPDGSVAKAFADADPLPSITWLDALGMHQVASGTDQEQPEVLGLSAECPVITCLLGNRDQGRTGLSKVAKHLARWLARHMQSTELIGWVNDGGAMVHDDWARDLGDRLERFDPPLPAPYAAYWCVVLSGVTKVPEPPPGVWGGGYGLSPHLPPKLLMARLIAALRPYLKPEPTLIPRNRPDKEPSRLGDLVRFQVKLAGGDAAWWTIQQLREDPQLTALLAKHLDDLTSLLVAALRLGREGEVEEITLGPVSIEDDPQGPMDHWQVLISVCRKAFDAALEHAPRSAEAVRSRWSLLGVDGDLTALRRLALYGFTADAQANPAAGLDLILANGAAMLWDFLCWAEVAAFLRTRGDQLESDAQNSLISRLLDGPPESKSADAKRLLAGRAYKLSEAGITLPGPLRQLSDAYKQSWSADQLVQRLDERRSFLVWSGFIEPEAADAILDQPPETIGDLVIRRGKQDPWQAGNLIADFARQKPFLSIKVLRYLFAKRLDSAPYIGAAFRGLGEMTERESPSDVFKDLAGLAHEFPQWSTGDGLTPLCSVLRIFAQKLSIEEERDCGFFDLWRHLWQALPQDETNPDEPDPWLAAMTSPAGELADSLLRRLWARGLVSSHGLPLELRPFFDRIASGEDQTHRSARIVLSSHLPRLYAINQPWCETELLHRLSGLHLEAPGLWRAVLWSGIWSPTLIAALEPYLISLGQLEVWQRLGSEITGRIAERLALVLVDQTPRLLSDETVSTIIDRMGAEELERMAQTYEQSLVRAGDKACVLWNQRIMSLIESYWPGSAAAHSPGNAFALAALALSAREAFQQALGLLKRRGILRRPVAHLGQLLWLLDEECVQRNGYDPVGHDPEPTLDLLSVCFGDDDATAHAKDLKPLLNRIVAVDVDLGSDPRFRRLSSRVR